MTLKPLLPGQTLGVLGGGQLGRMFVHAAQRMGDYKGPLYGLFESEFGVRMIRAEEKIRAVAADGEVAGVLGVDAGSPLLRVERLSFTYGDKPVELRRGFYDTSTHHYRNELN